MAKTISELNSMLNCERNKTENLLAENFSLKQITKADRHHKGSNNEDDTVIELPNNGQSNENKQKRPSKAKTKSLQRQKQSKQEQ